MGSTQKKHLARAVAELLGCDTVTALATVEAEANSRVAAGEASGFLAALRVMRKEFEAAGLEITPRPNDPPGASPATRPRRWW